MLFTGAKVSDFSHYLKHIGICFSEDGEAGWGIPGTILNSLSSIKDKEIKGAKLF